MVAEFTPVKENVWKSRDVCVYVDVCLAGAGGNWNQECWFILHNIGSANKL